MLTIGHFQKSLPSSGSWKIHPKLIDVQGGGVSLIFIQCYFHSDSWAGSDKHSFQYSLSDGRLNHECTGAKNYGIISRIYESDEIPGCPEVQSSQGEGRPWSDFSAAWQRGGFWLKTVKICALKQFKSIDWCFSGNEVSGIPSIPTLNCIITINYQQNPR